MIGILLPTQSLKGFAFCAKFSGANVNIVKVLLYNNLIRKVKVQIIQIGCDNINRIIGYSSKSI